MQEVKDVVYAVLREIGVPESAMVPEAELLILMVDEDVTFWFVPQVERLLKTKIPVTEWERVRTVSETIDMLERHLSDRLSGLSEP
jgi:hypothetical protein